MKNHTGAVRAFSVLSQAWYAKHDPDDTIIDRIMLGFYHSDGGTSGEFSIRWKELSGRVVPRLCAFDDAWSALHHFADVIEALAALDDKAPSSMEVCTVLKRCGLVDQTARQRPAEISASRAPGAAHPADILLGLSKRTGVPTDPAMVERLRACCDAPASPSSAPGVVRSADAYRAACDAAMKYAGPGDDQWSTRFINGLDANGLCLWARYPPEDTALYPGGHPYTAPRPPDFEDERDWSKDAVVVWKDAHACPPPSDS